MRRLRAGDEHGMNSGVAVSSDAIRPEYGVRTTKAGGAVN